MSSRTSMTRPVDEMTDHPRPPEADLLALRRQIVAGTYLTDDKLDIAVERLLKVLTGPARRQATGA